MRHFALDRNDALCVNVNDALCVKGGKMKRSDPQMRIRVPVDVKEWLEKEAARNMRTQNAELVMAVRAKMATTGINTPDDIA